MVRTPRRVIAAFIVAGGVAAAVAVNGLGLNTDEDAMFSERVSYASKRAAFESAFPGLVDPILILLEGAEPTKVNAAARALQTRLLQEPAHFPAVQDPQAHDFYARHALLYLDVDTLQETTARLIEAQPLLGHYAQDPSLRGLAELVQRILQSSEASAYAGFEPTLNALAQGLEDLLAGTAAPLDWGAQFNLPTQSTPAQRYLLVRPTVDHSLLEPAGAALNALRSALTELGLDNDAPANAVRAHVTGLYPLSSEEAYLLEQQVRRAGLLSLLLVCCVLSIGLRSLSLVCGLVCTLLTGLALTAAFATVTVGHLNLITVAFSVLFIGLSVDFGIHLSARYQEQLRTGLDPAAALGAAARTTGTALVICTITTAAAFFAFIPSDFVGISELGLICGGAMFIGLLTNLSLLPAIIRVTDGRRGHASPMQGTHEPRGILERHYRTIIIAAVLLAIAAGTLMPKVSFDHNPLRLRDPNTESVRAFNALLRTGNAYPWNLSVLADSLEAADKSAAALEALPSVAEALTLHDLIPTAQASKLALIEPLDLLIGPTLIPAADSTPPTPEESHQALQQLARTATTTQATPAAARLAAGLNRLLTEEDPDRLLHRLHTLWAAPLTHQLERLRTAIQVTQITPTTLQAEPELAAQRMTTDGRTRIEIFPAEDLNENASLERFVQEVQGVAPEAFGESLVIYESGRIVTRSFLSALGYAAAAIILLLTLLWRNLADVALVTITVSFAALLTAAISALIGLSFNFANVIVIPLLLGMGVDSGIHLVHRRRHDSDGPSILQTSTTRAVILSALTTLASFGTLAITTHPGMASLGKLLTLGILLMLLSNLILLPSLAEYRRRVAGS